jgi:hypothetical protein
MYVAFPREGSPALEAVLTEAVSAAVVFMGAAVSTEAAVADIGERVYPRMELVETSKTKGTTMLQNISRVDEFRSKKFIRLAAPVLFAIFSASWLAPTFAQQPGQQTFSSVDEAGRAMFAALQAPDDRALLGILGPAGNDIVSSGDPTEDLETRNTITAKYEEMHRFVREPDGMVTLVVGAENWPLPIPLANKNGAWYFDTQAAKDEILFRRIGKNEMLAMQSCGDLVGAEKQYYNRAPSGYSNQYAQKLVSDAGKHNGLYWEGEDDQFESPVDPRIAYARQNLPGDQVGEHVPFNGYYFRILTSQGPHAPGGAKKYVVGGKMTQGFAIVAYPVEYRSSGVETFIVSKSGTIYGKDLGPNTTKLAPAMTAFDPDSTWHKEE